MLELKDVGKTYVTKAEKIEVLKDINFKFENGDFFSIQGKSGSGKTTLLNILGLLDFPTEGEVFIDGEKVLNNKLTDLRRKKVGFVFQFHYLLNEFTALENVMIPALVDGKNRKKEIEEKAKKILEEVGLKERINHKPNELSGGEKQRVAIARALINEPEIILADEPTGNLDYETSNLINELFVNLNKKGQGIIIVTHSIELANLAKVKYKIENGKLKQI
ncbi:ABC transporter ATP-binding protein [Streptobacillus felis]|uniref:ABC transporter ATP-binding protein n=1 Tax=Streptobacillus felis TaxID=1384509 RepID=A0A7Z0PDW4_9FUSO|nr:ABC transporter ATP-binding protein [Streptobacillus felis]NYV27209.1 ABC transporter ATP-binding protein [Streptobacillus felis]